MHWPAARFPGRRLLGLFLLSPIMIPHVVIALALFVYFFQIKLSHGELRLVLGAAGWRPCRS